MLTFTFRPTFPSSIERVSDDAPPILDSDGVSKIFFPQSLPLTGGGGAQTHVAKEMSVLS